MGRSSAARDAVPGDEARRREEERRRVAERVVAKPAAREARRREDGHGGEQRAGESRHDGRHAPRERAQRGHGREHERRLLGVGLAVDPRDECVARLEDRAGDEAVARLVRRPEVARGATPPGRESATATHSTAAREPRPPGPRGERSTRAGPTAWAGWYAAPRATGPGTDRAGARSPP